MDDHVFCALCTTSRPACQASMMARCLANALWSSSIQTDFEWLLSEAIKGSDVDCQLEKCAHCDVAFQSCWFQNSDQREERGQCKEKKARSQLVLRPATMLPMLSQGLRASQNGYGLKSSPKCAMDILNSPISHMLFTATHTLAAMRLGPVRTFQPVRTFAGWHVVDFGDSNIDIFL